MIKSFADLNRDICSIVYGYGTNSGKVGGGEDGKRRIAASFFSR